eukprot:Pgem_evm1s10346
MNSKINKKIDWLRASFKPESKVGRKRNSAPTPGKSSSEGSLPTNPNFGNKPENIKCNSCGLVIGDHVINSNYNPSDQNFEKNITSQSENIINDMSEQ